MAVVIRSRAHGLAVVDPPGLSGGHPQTPGDVVGEHVLAVRPPAMLCFILRLRTSVDIERATAIAALLTAPAAPTIVTRNDAFEHIALSASLGVSLATLLARAHDEGGALDEDVAGFIYARVEGYRQDVVYVTGAPVAVDAGDVWLGWDGSVRVYPAVIDGRPVVDAAAAERGLAPAIAGLARGDVAAGAQRLAGVLAGLFPNERARDLEWLDELFIEEITENDVADPPGPSAEELIHHARIVDDGIAPAILVTDLVPCSVLRGERYQRQAMLRDLAAGRPQCAPVANLIYPVADLIAALLDDFRARNTWRIPTQAEWLRLSADGGVGRPSRYGVRQLGRVWEMTSSPFRQGMVVCGGKWRDDRRLPDVSNSSHEDRPMPDVGFRAVRFVNDDDDNDWEPRT